MSLKEMMEEINNLKSKVEEILDLLKQIKSNENEKLEAVAAKIINELKIIIQEGPCHKEVIERKELKLTPSIVQDKSKAIGLEKYSYPNYGVGNAELGSSGNPKALTWPFGENQ